MKLNKEDLKKKVNEIVTDNDVAIQLLEDIEDSFDESAEVDNTKIDSYKLELTNSKLKLMNFKENTKKDF